MISGTKRFIALFLVFLIVFIIPVQLWAGDKYDNKAIITYDGEVGYFFDEETGDEILEDLTEFKKLKYEKIPALELKLKLQTYDLELHKRDVKFVERVNEKLEDSLQDSEDLREKETKYLREQLEKKQVWYKHPVTYFVIGILVGGALSVGLAFGLQEAKE